MENEFERVEDLEVAIFRYMDKMSRNSILAESYPIRKEYEDKYIALFEMICRFGMYDKYMSYI